MSNLTTKQTAKENSTWIMDCQKKHAAKICNDYFRIIDELQQVVFDNGDEDDVSDELESSLNEIETIINDIKEKENVSIKLRNKIRFIGKHAIQIAIVNNYDYTLN